MSVKKIGGTDYGAVLDYVQKTTDTSITATTAAGANTVVTGASVTYNGSTTILLEYHATSITLPNVADGQVIVTLYEDSTQIGYLAQVGATAADTTNRHAIRASRRFTPSAGSHTYSIRVWLTPSGTGTVIAGPGGTNEYSPTYMRITADTAFIPPSTPMPGYEYDYVEKTSNTTVTATTEASANTVVTSNAVVLDGSTTILVQFFAGSVRCDTGGGQIDLWLYDGSSSIGRFGTNVGPSGSGHNKPMKLERRLTPSAATKTYSIRASVDTGSGLVSGGAGGAATFMPVFIRITKV